MKWLITGGCGFIGTRLVQSLLADGESRIRLVDDLSTGTRRDLADVAPGFVETGARDVAPVGEHRVELVVADVLDEEAALAAAEGADVIVHLAANTGVQPSLEDPRRDCLVNVLGTLNYLEAARVRGVPRFVFASSGGTVIGDCEPPIDEEMVPHPKSPYGASKSAGEGYMSAYHGSFGIETVSLRFGNVFGPGSNHKNSVVARFIRRALAGEQLVVFGDGSQTRDFIFIDDLIDAVRRAARVPGVGGRVYQIATNAETTVNELAEGLASVLAEVGVPRPAIVHTAPLAGEIRRNYADTSRARRELEWQVRTTLDDGLRKTVDWFMDRSQNVEDGRPSIPA